MGVNKLLKAGIAKEKMQLEDNTSASKTETARSSKPAPAAKEKKTAPKKKNPGGRPTNKELGLKKRKQYTLTLTEDDYDLFLQTARKNYLSFAKFMEKAAHEYIEQHKYD